MDKVESMLVLIALGVVLVLAAGIGYAIWLVGAERLHIYAMIILIILGVAVFMRGLKWVIVAQHLHQHPHVERETVREVRILDGRSAQTPRVMVLPPPAGQLNQIYPEMARAAINGPAPWLNAPPALASGGETPAEDVWDTVGSLVESDQWSY